MYCLKQELNSNECTDFTVSKSELEWQQIFDPLPDMIAIMGVDYKIKKVNKSMLNILGVKSEELIEKECYTLMHCSHGPLELCSHAKLLEDSAIPQVEFPIELFKGDFHVSASPKFNRKYT